MDFIVARNPDSESSLPYLLFVPLGDGLWLKAKDAWPRSARVYCHPSDAPDAASLVVVERVPVIECVRRGIAIDLILDRGMNKRSQFVQTTFRGRSMILWQTPKAALSARPGVRVPHARALEKFTLVVDTRERYGFRFASRPVDIVRRALSAGDYAVMREDVVIASIERKTVEDFVKSLVDGTLVFAMAELATLPHAAVVVEGSYAALLRHTFTSPGFLVEIVARLAISYPSVPIVFLDSRKLAEEWSYRYLSAAVAASAQFQGSSTAGTKK